MSPFAWSPMRGSKERRPRGSPPRPGCPRERSTGCSATRAASCWPPSKGARELLPVDGSCRREDPLETLEELGRLHTESMVSSGVDHFIAPLFAFMAAPAHVGLREAVAKGQQRIVDTYAEILESGRAKGRPGHRGRTAGGVDDGGGVLGRRSSSLVGMPGFVLEGRSRKGLQAVLRCFARCDGCPDSAAPNFKPGARTPPA